LTGAPVTELTGVRVDRTRFDTEHTSTPSTAANRHTGVLPWHVSTAVELALPDSAAADADTS
jgi:hypothetical protein